MSDLIKPPYYGAERRKPKTLDEAMNALPNIEVPEVLKRRVDPEVMEKYLRDEITIEEFMSMLEE